MSITNAQLAQDVNDLVAFFDDREDEFAAWMTGAAGGGVASDGKYPLTDRQGNTIQAKSPLQLEADVTGLVNSASTFKDDAETAATAAETAESNAADSEANALAYRDAALVAETDAQAAQSAAENAATNATAAKNSAEAAQAYAEQWANRAEDSLITAAAGGNEVDEYSSLHWAAKASASASAAAGSATAASDSATAASDSATAAADSAASAAQELGNLTDVNVGTPGAGEDGYALVWDNDTSEYILAEAASSLANFTDNGIVGQISHDGSVVAVSFANGLQMRSDAFPQVQFFNAAGSTRYGSVFFDVADSELTIRNRLAGGDVVLMGYDTSDEPLARFTQGAGAEFYYDNGGVAVLSTHSRGITVEAGGSDNTNLAIDQTNDATALRVLNFLEGGQTRLQMFYDPANDEGIIRQTQSGHDIKILNSVNGSFIEMIAGGPVYLYNNGDLVLETDGTGISVRDGDGSAPVINLKDDTGTTLAQVFHNLGTHIKSLQHGATVRFQGEDNAGVTQNIFVGDPDAAASMYHAGSEAIATTVDGADFYNTEAAGSRGEIGVFGSGDSYSMRMRKAVAGGRGDLYNEHPAGNIYLTARNLADSSNHDLFRGDPEGAVYLYHNDSLAFMTDPQGIRTYDTSGAAPALLGYDDSSNLVGFLQWGANNIWESRTHGADFRIRGEDAGGTLRNIVVADPDNSTNLYWNGSLAANTDAAGFAIRDTDGSVPVLYLRSDSGTTLSQIFVSTDTYIRSLVHGARVRMEGEDAGGTLRNIFFGDPDAESIMYHAGSPSFQTQSNGGQVRDTSGADPLFGLADDSGANLAVVQVSGSVLLIDNRIHGGPITMRAENNAGTAVALFTGDPDTGVAFNGSPAIAKQTVTGSRGGNAALANLLTALANVGLITDSTTA
jgi:hypothetical protein